MAKAVLRHGLARGALGNSLKGRQFQGAPHKSLKGKM
jgi:hypothetical protein